jgi:polyisoprenoid-binding protein YceI
LITKTGALKSFGKLKSDFETIKITRLENSQKPTLHLLQQINMKKNTLIIGFAAIALAMGSCGSNATEASGADSVAQADSAASTYTVDAASSTLGWFGTHVVGTGDHTGTINITEGSLSLANGNITAGSFVVDMASIKCTDSLPAEYLTKLHGHFAGEDFFNTAKFPTAKFEITACEAKADGENTHFISGNLTLRDSTKNISFPAKVTVANGVTATAKVVINRLDWGINYDKDNMTLAEAAQKKLKNGVVSKDITLNISLTAKK